MKSAALAPPCCGKLAAVRDRPNRFPKNSHGFSVRGHGTRVALTHIGTTGLTAILTFREERRCAMVKKISARYLEILRCVKNEDGITILEYALVGTLISIAAITIMTTVGTQVVTAFTTISTAL
jgi:pilus assembly protein Flp/PilA